MHFPVFYLSNSLNLVVTSTTTFQGVRFPRAVGGDEAAVGRLPRTSAAESVAAEIRYPVHLERRVR